MKEIGFLFDSLFTYIEQYIQLIANQIATTGKNDEETIIKILTSFKPKIKKVSTELIGIELFDFINPRGKVIADIGGGKIEKELYVSKKIREYMELAPKEPWKLHICLPDLEITRNAKHRTMPFGYGVTDLQNNFLGIISGGVTIENLKQELAKVIQNENYAFVVLNNDLEYLFYSENEESIAESNKAEIKNKLQYLKAKDKNFGTLNETLYIDGAEYIFYTKANDYPFIIIIGIKRKEIFNLRDLEKKMIELNKAGQYNQMFLFALLYMFQTKIINPIVGDRCHYSNFEIPKVFSTQLNDLFLALDQMENFMEIKIQKEVAEEASKEREKFFQMVLHDLKSPSGIIDNILQLIEDKNIETEEALKMMKGAIAQIIHIVNSLQLIAQMKSKTLKLNKTEVNIEKIIDNIFTAFKFEADSKGIYLKKKIKIANPCLNADKLLMTRILTNLVSNSIKFTSKGGVTVTVKDLGNNRIIKVKDTGCGIEKEKILKVLNDTDISNRYGSTGLGLPIVKKFVEMHNGTFEINSQIDKGSKIVLRFKKDEGY